MSLLALAVAPADAIRSVASEGAAAAGGGEPARPLTVAVYPVHALSGAPFPRAALENLLRYEVARLGLRVVPTEVLDAFLRRHRLRWTGGVDRRSGALLEAELDVEAVLVTSVDGYDESRPPRIALTSRLVSSGADPKILWMDAVHRAGDQAPGVLDLGLVEEPRRLTEMALRELASSLERYLAGKETQRPPWGTRERLGPKSFSGSPEAIAGAAGSRGRVAVLPFLNDSGRPAAGEILMLQVVRHLAVAGVVELYEPGVVREALLQVRLIQDEGLSLAQVDTLRALLPLDVVLTGRVSEYRDPLGTTDTPEVGFTLRAIDAADRQAVWASVSYNRGRDGVFFFDAGRLYTAHELAFEMTRSALNAMTRWTARKVRKLRRSLREPEAPSS